MDANDHDMHIRAGIAYGKDATCGNKIDYKSESSANRAVEKMMKKGSKQLESYPCAFCHGWHIGRKLSELEINKFQS